MIVAESQHDSGKMGVSANPGWVRGYCPFKENRLELKNQHGSLCAARRTGRFLFVPAVSTYNKPYLTFEQQLELLKKRGMEIAAGAEPAVLAGLRRIGYYRLSAYWYPLRKTDESRGSSVQRLDDFRHGATFGQVLGLYEFDKRLRLLVLDAIELVEVSLRVSIAYHLGRRDPFAHMKPELLHGGFVKKAKSLRGVQGHGSSRPGRSEQATDYDDWLRKHDEVVSRSKEVFVQHYLKKYGEPLPIWVSIELWEFGMLTRFFGGMKNEDQEEIASQYEVPGANVLESWLRTMNVLRNVAAHHGRLWNRIIAFPPRLPPRGGRQDLDFLWELPEGSKGRLFSRLSILLYLVSVIDPESSWPLGLRELLGNFPEIPELSLADMGFPQGWTSLPLWARCLERSSMKDTGGSLETVIAAEPRNPYTVYPARGEVITSAHVRRLMDEGGV